jgi:hypothetical protein
MDRPAVTDAAAYRPGGGGIRLRPRVHEPDGRTGRNRSGSQQAYLPRVFRYSRAVPVSRAVDRQLRDRTVGDIGPEQLPAVPRLTVLLPSVSNSEMNFAARSLIPASTIATGYGVAEDASTMSGMTNLPSCQRSRHDGALDQKA